MKYSTLALETIFIHNSEISTDIALHLQWTLATGLFSYQGTTIV